MFQRLTEALVPLVQDALDRLAPTERIVFEVGLMAAPQPPHPVVVGLVMSAPSTVLGSAVTTFMALPVVIPPAEDMDRVVAQAVESLRKERSRVLSENNGRSPA